jgi:uncharacterized integral membrane protein
MTRARELGLVILTAAVIFFAMQNLHDVNVAFLWFEGALPLSIIALVPLLIGLLVGAGTAIVFGHRKGRRARERERERMTEMKVGGAAEDTFGTEDEPGRLPSAEPALPEAEREKKKERAESERRR